MQISNYELKKNGLLISYTVLILLSIIFKNFFSIIVFGLFPAIWIFKLTKKNFLVAVPLIFAVNISILIVSAVVLSILNIPVYLQTLLIFNFVTTSVGLLAIKKSKFDLIDVGDFHAKSIIGLYLMFTIALVARVYSVIGDQVPILHDPISHAYWAKTIDVTHTIKYTYSPGLHILIMVFSKSFDISFAQSTLYITNFFSAATVLTWGVVAYLITKSKFFTISLGLAIFALPYPQALYSSQGKNTLIVAVTFAPFVFLFLKWFLEHTNLKNSLLLSLSLLTIIFIHLPAGLFIIAVVVLFILINAFKKLTDRKLFYGLIKNSIFVGLLTVLITAFWYVGTNTDRVRVENGVVSAQKAYGIEKVEQSPSLRMQPIASMRHTYLQFKSSYDEHGLFYTPFVLASLLVILLLGNRTRYISILLIFLSVFSLCVAINFFDISYLDIVLETGLLLAFPLLALCLSGALTLLWDNSSQSKVLAIVSIIVVTVISFKYGISQYRAFNTNTSGFTMVDRSDVAAFRWITQNTNRNDIFLNDAEQHSVMKDRIFPTSGASWLPVFAGNRITMGFHNALYNQNRTHNFYRSYIGLETNFEKSFCDLYNAGVRYYYRDLRTPYPNKIDVLDLATEGNFKKVYSNSGVAIYRLQDVRGECS